MRLQYQLCISLIFFCISLLDCGSTWSLDGLPEEVFQQWEAEAIEINRQAKAKLKIALQDTPPCAVPSTSKPIDIGPSRTASAQALRTDPDSSVTPNYIPPPTRIFKRGAALQSPYAEAGLKISFKCSRAMAKTYDAVCTCIRSTRTRDRRYFWTSVLPLCICTSPTTSSFNYIWFHLTKKFFFAFVAGHS